MRGANVGEKPHKELTPGGFKFVEHITSSYYYYPPDYIFTRE